MLLPQKRRYRWDVKLRLYVTLDEASKKAGAGWAPLTVPADKLRSAQPTRTQLCAKRPHMKLGRIQNVAKKENRRGFALAFLPTKSGLTPPGPTKRKRASEKWAYGKEMRKRKMQQLKQRICLPSTTLLDRAMITRSPARRQNTRQELAGGHLLHRPSQ